MTEQTPLKNNPEKIQAPVKMESVTSQVSPWLTRLAYPLRFVVFPTYFGRIDITGQENLPKHGPVILAPTHRSRWDSVMIPYATGRHVTGRDLRFMVSIDEIKGFQGWFIRRLGGFPVDPKNPGVSSFRHSVELLRQGEMLVIFPEGNIFRDNVVHPLKPGIARIALQAQSKVEEDVHIVPISLYYSQEEVGWGTDVNITIGKAIRVADYRNEPPKKATLKLTANLETALKTLDQETIPNEVFESVAA